MNTKTDKTALWNHLAKTKAWIKWSAAMTSLARRGSAKASTQYNALWEKGDKGYSNKGTHARKLNELHREEWVWRSMGETGGSNQRHRLLAYGYLRGRTYLQMESNCASDNKPDVDAIVKHATFWGGPDKEVLRDSIKLWMEAGDVSANKVGSCLEEAARVSKAKNELTLAKTRLANSRRTKDSKQRSFELEERTHKNCVSAVERAKEENKAADVALKAAANAIKKEDGWDLEHPLGEPKTDAGAGVA